MKEMGWQTCSYSLQPELSGMTCGELKRADGSISLLWLRWFLSLDPQTGDSHYCMLIADVPLDSSCLVMTTLSGCVRNLTATSIVSSMQSSSMN